jgi:hypothetical protein
MVKCSGSITVFFQKDKTRPLQQQIYIHSFTEGLQMYSTHLVIRITSEKVHDCEHKNSSG